MERKTARDYSIFSMGRSNVNPRMEAAVAEQTQTPLYGIPPQNIPQTGQNPYMPGDPRLVNQGPSMLDLLLLHGRNAIRQNQIPGLLNTSQPPGQISDRDMAILGLLG